MSTLDSGLPARLEPLAKSLQGVAVATMKARHPGPRQDPKESLQRLIEKPPPLITPLQSPRRGKDDGYSASPAPCSQDAYDPYNPYYKGATEDMRRINFLQKTGKIGQPSSKPKTTISAATKSSKSTNKFQLTCDYCDFKTMETEDGSALAGLVAMVQYHEKTKHPEQLGVVGPPHVTAEASTGVAKEIEAYQKATAPVIIPEAVDDRVSSFSKGRFLMGPIGWGNLLTQAPLSQEPGDGNMDLWHVGVPFVEPKLAIPLHNRIARGLKCDKFTTFNINNRDPLPKLNFEETGLAMEPNYKETKQVGDLVLACLNYMELMREIHPYDYGPRAIFRVVMEHYAKDKVKSPGPIHKFFMTITEENASRACRGRPSLTYEECDARWARINPVTYGTDLDDDNNNSSRSKKRQHEVHIDENSAKVIAAAFANHIAAPKANRAQTAKKPRKSSGLWCKYFNKGPCPNAPTAQGCIGPDKIAYIHSCSVKVPPGNRACGSRDHNALSHV